MSTAGTAAQHEQTIACTVRSGSLYKPLVIGLYGLPGSGKTHLLNKLSEELAHDCFKFYEGSAVISDIVDGGLDAFKKLPEERKAHYRGLAINKIREECAATSKAGVLTGHFMFWHDGEDAPPHVLTQKDLEIFTHIFYLDVPGSVIAQQSRDDTESGKRDRQRVPIEHFVKWREEEIHQLKTLSSKHGIFFNVLHSDEVPGLGPNLQAIHFFCFLTEQGNTQQAKDCLDLALVNYQSDVKKVLMFDADKTLATEDAGELFWTMVSPSSDANGEDSPLKRLFSSALGYTYDAFRQATLLNEESVGAHQIEAFCNNVALKIKMHPELVQIMKRAAELEHTAAVVVTSGVRLVWEKVLEREGLSGSVSVVGGGRIADGMVVTAEVKQALVRHLQDKQMCVWAFGDSPLDLKMLCQANQAIIVVGPEETRSKSMDFKLEEAIKSGDLRGAKQVLLPGNVSPRLDTTRLPVVSLTAGDFVEQILSTKGLHHEPRISHATESLAAKILATRTRDASNAGPALQQAHHRVGWYLAHRYVTEELGIEECPIRHVLGHEVEGFRLAHEDKTTIVAIMRAGDPMARGVHEAFPNALYRHAHKPEDIEGKHLQGQHTALLVDSVINNGNTIAKFITQVRRLNATMRIVLVAGVVQAQAIEEGPLYKELTTQPELSLVALRLSKTKFTGKGGTDTGNRLFNTTHLD